MKLLTLELALTFIATTIALAAHESNSCSAQNTKTSPTAEEIDGNAIESLELVEGESKKLNYQQPIQSGSLKPVSYTHLTLPTILLV